MNGLTANKYGLSATKSCVFVGFMIVLSYTIIMPNIRTNQNASHRSSDLSAYHILVVDDDDRIRQLVQKYLTEQGFMVAGANSAQQARDIMAVLSFDLLVLDVMMPTETGIEFTHRLRQSSTIPILMLTAMGDIDDRLNGLGSGADDYLAKPFDPQELSLRIQAILRRSQRDTNSPTHTSLVWLGEHCFDREREVLLKENIPISLTGGEKSLLSVLSNPTGQVRSREELTQQCRIDGEDRAIDVQITRLRRKIEPNVKIPQFIQTIRGKGYVLHPSKPCMSVS